MIARDGETCWRRARADRFGVIVDAAAYFDILVDAFEAARESIVIVGWDVHSRLRLRRSDDGPELRDLLDRLARGRPSLRIHVLSWDFAMIYALEREVLPVVRFDWWTHERMHFVLDDLHPPGGSQHQKIIVVDDAIAFCGGIDLTMRRWDTSAHRPRDDRRHDPEGAAYRPFHDVQAAVSGPAAAALGDLVRERWRRATGEALAPPSAPGDETPWPAMLEPVLRDADVAIARTEPRYADRGEVREIERFYVAAIAAARSSIYLENQFFTSAAIVDALARRLAEPDGPQVLVVGPRRATGWLEQATMGVLRHRAVTRLRGIAGRERLRVCWPHRRGLDVEHSINVHSKVAVVDDTVLTIGSANLANRSMGLDTECNLWVEDDGHESTRAGIASVRDRLLAEHLGTGQEEVATRIGADGLLAAVATLGGDGRELRDVEDDALPSWADGLVPDGDVLDPERPLPAAELFERMAPTDEDTAGAGDDGRGWWRRWTAGVLALAALVVLAALWSYGPLGRWLPADRVGEWIAAYRDSPLALLWTVVAYAGLGVVLFPLTLLIVQTALVFDPWTALLHAMSGSLVSAAVGWTIGRLAGRGRLRRMAGHGASRVGRLIRDQGVLTMAAVRLIPVAPYGVVNLVAGAVGVRLRPFLLGTLLGLLPGIVGLTLFGNRLAAAVRHPDATSIVLVVAVATVAIVAARWLRHRAARRAAETEADAG